MSLVTPDKNSFNDEWKNNPLPNFFLAMGSENDYDMLLQPFNRKLVNMSENT